MRTKYFVYLVTNKGNTVIYTGVTNNLIKRIYDHKQNQGSKFTSKYNVNKLVYYEVFDSALDAITREKQIKAGSREKKMKLIIKNNPSFKDLYSEII